MRSYEPIESRYFGKEAVTLYDGSITIEFEQGQAQLEGRIAMSFGSTNLLTVEGSALPSNLYAFRRTEKLVLKTPSGLSGHVSIKGNGFSEADGQAVRGTVNHLTAFKSETKMDRLVLHAANFVEGLCGYEVDYDTMQAPTHVPITLEDWVIGIQTGYMPEENKLVNNGQEQWDYALTHVLDIRKQDGRSFTLKEVTPVMDALRDAFTFCAGRRVAFPIKQGYIQDVEIAAEYTRVFIDRYSTGIKENWFLYQGSESLMELLPLIYHKAKHPHIKQAIGRSIHWLAESYQTIFAGQPAVATQNGLETVWWVILTQLPDSPLDEKGYKVLQTAANRMQAMAQQLQLDMKFPPFAELDKEKLKKAGPKITDFPTLFAHYRNHLIYPKAHPVFDHLRFEDEYSIVRASKQYLELGLLYIFGYTGNYTDHAELTGQTVRQVPWAQKRMTDETARFTAGLFGEESKEREGNQK